MANNPPPCDRRRLVLLLDVHVEGVEVDFQRGTADSPDHFECLVAGVDEISFKTVQRFEADLAAPFLGYLQS
jgi:hypothetical protein